jgi:hypothetical protein
MVWGLLKRNSHGACARGWKKDGGVSQTQRSAVSGQAQFIITGEKTSQV